MDLGMHELTILPNIMIILGMIDCHAVGLCKLALIVPRPFPIEIVGVAWGRPQGYKFKLDK